MIGKFINHCEDSLTAAVFTHLLHLPTEVFWQILRNACYTTSLPENSGEPKCVEFWPPWNPEGTENMNRVIPDLFIRFASFDLIIESKREDEWQQYRGQWENEVTAYGNEYGSENVPVRMIALGGIWDTKDEIVTTKSNSCPVHMCKWTRVLDECKRMRKDLERLKYPSSQTQAHVRTLTHLIDLFAWHGFQTGEWFADLVANSQLVRLVSSSASHHKALQRMSIQLKES
jgi:hypothetical protein